ncbi:MAG: hypothetical protein ACYTBJ_07460 [Planctomycetota bacterium]|jgi:hypothetical protein
MKAISVLTGIFGLMIAPLLPEANAQQMQWLRYCSAREARRIMPNIARQSVDVSHDKPKDVQLPQFKGAEPFFAKWATPMVKSGHLWMTLDRTHKYGPYDLLFIDSNRDGNLNDETAVTAYRVEQQETSFGPVKVVFEGEDGPITYHLNFEFYHRDNYTRLICSSGGWYEGTITVGDRQKHCTLIDQNANGTFDDKSSDFWQSDRILIGKKENQTSSFVGNYLQVDGVLYQPEIARDGAYIKLAKAEDVKFGNVRMPEAITEFVAGGENGLLTATLEKGIGRLPVGEYRIHHWQIERKDEKDANWKLRGEWFGDNGDFEVTKEGRPTLKIGEPIYSKLKATKGDSEYSFDQETKGQLGERIGVVRGGSQARPPKLRITSGDGKYDRTFAFEYG